MPYEPESGGHLKTIVGVVVAIIVAAVVGGIVRTATGEGIHYANTSTSAVESEMESAFAQNPKMARFYGLLKDNYPEEYEAFLKNLSSGARNRVSSEQLYETGFVQMQNFMRSKSSFVRRASPDALAAAVATQRRFAAEALSISPGLCARFMVSGLNASDQIPSSLSDEVVEMSIATMQAAISGEQAGVERVKATDGDWEAMASAMVEEGVSPEELDIMFGGGPSSLADSRECEIGIEMYDAIAKLPVESASRISAEIFNPTAAK